jgi:hypothetical protein
LQLTNDLEHTSFTNNLRAWGDVLPSQQPAHELSGSDRLNLLAQRAERKPMNARQQAAIAPFNCRAPPLSPLLSEEGTKGWCGRTGELPSQHSAFGLEAKHGSLDIGRRQSYGARQPGNLDRSGVRHPTSNELEQGIVSRKNRLTDFGSLRLKACPGEES